MKPLVAFNAEMNDVAQLEADAKAWVAKKVNLTGVPMEIREAAEEGDELIERFLALIGERVLANRVVPDTLDHEMLARFVGQLRLASGREITDAVAGYLHSLNFVEMRAEDWTEQPRYADFRKAYTEACRGTAAAHAHVKVTRRDAYWIWWTIQSAMSRENIDPTQYTGRHVRRQPHTMIEGDPPREFSCDCALVYDHHADDYSTPVEVLHRDVHLGLRTTLVEGHQGEVTQESLVALDNLCPHCHEVLPDAQVDPYAKAIVSGAVVWKSFKESHDFDFRVTRPDENEGFGKCICGWDTGDLEMTESDAEVKFDQHLDDERRELGEI